MKSLASRLRKLERKALRPASAPNVLEVKHGETIEQAYVRFRARWPITRAGHRFMVVPATMTVAEFRVHAEARCAERRRAFEASNYAREASL